MTSKEHTTEERSSAAANGRVGSATDDTRIADDAGPSADAPAQSDAADASPDAVIAALTRERDELKDKLLRAQAECANIAKRLSQQHAHERRHASLGLAKAMLPILDGLERTLASVETVNRQDAFVDGVRLLRDEFLKTLRQHGVEPIESVGRPFDPELHEALMQDVHSELPPGTVTLEHEKGYTMHERVLRHAKVVVAAARDDGRNADSDNPASAGSASQSNEPSEAAN